MFQKKILVTGGAGFIGSYVCHFLADKNFDVYILDDLSKGKREAVKDFPLFVGDIADKKLLEQIFSEHHFDATIHFAALTDVGESVEHPQKYYENNVYKSFIFWKTAVEHGILCHLFSSSAAVYGLPQSPTIPEEHPQNPINPYGMTKLMGEVILRGLTEEHHLHAMALRYFNAAGGDPAGKIKHNPSKPNNLIPIIMKALVEGKKVSIFGDDYPTYDGTCIRDYIHIHDLAEAHYRGLEYIFQKEGFKVYNLGVGRGFSVKEVVAAADAVTGRSLEVEITARREGDPPFLVADAHRAHKDLNWMPQYIDIEQIVLDAWKAKNQEYAPI